MTQSKKEFYKGFGIVIDILEDTDLLNDCLGLNQLNTRPQILRGADDARRLAIHYLKNI